MTQYAKFETRSAMLSTEFGEKLARKYFSDEVINSLPKYVKGKRKGLIKGFVEWKKCVEGGWVKGESGSGSVENRRNSIVEISLFQRDYVSGETSDRVTKTIMTKAQEEEAAEIKREVEESIQTFVNDLPKYRAHVVNALNDIREYRAGPKDEFQEDWVNLGMKKAWRDYKECMRVFSRKLKREKLEEAA